MVAEAGASAGAATAQETLVASTVNVAWLSGTMSAMPPAVGAIARGVLRRIALARARHVASACVALVLLIGVIAPLLTRANSPGKRIATIVAPVFSTQIGANTSVQILGVSSFPPSNDTWFAADGTPIDLPHPNLLGQSFQTALPPQFAVAVRIDHPTSDLMRVEVPGSVSGSNMEVAHENDQMIVMAVFSFSSERIATDLRLAIADGSWQTIATNESPRESTSLPGQVGFDAIADSESGGTKVVVRHPPIRDPFQLVVVDDGGRQHAPLSIAVQSMRQITTTCTFDVPADNVEKILLQTKPFTRVVEASEVSLERGRKTRPQLAVRDAHR
jgi:hypothetical protein